MFDRGDKYLNRKQWRVKWCSGIKVGEFLMNKTVGMNNHTMTCWTGEQIGKRIYMPKAVWWEKAVVWMIEKGAKTVKFIKSGLWEWIVYYLRKFGLFILYGILVILGIAVIWVIVKICLNETVKRLCCRKAKQNDELLDKLVASQISLAKQMARKRSRQASMESLLEV